MARNTIVQISDDLDGSANAETYTFAFQGTEYEIDLSNKNAKAFEKVLAPYIEAGTKQAKRSTGRRSSSNGGKRTDLTDVRAWGKENGFNVSERGRVPAELLSAYDAR